MIVEGCADSAFTHPSHALPITVTMSSLSACTGHVFALVFRHGHAARLTPDGLADALALPHDWAWLHLGLSDHRARRFLESWPPLDASARALMLGAEDRVQLHLTGATAQGVLPDFDQDFADEGHGPGRLLFWLDGTTLITARRHPLRAVESLRAAVEAGLALESPAAALAALQAGYIALAEARLALLAQGLGRHEDAMLGGRLDRLPLGPLRRELSRQGRECAALRGALHRVLSARGGTPGGPLLPYLAAMLQDAEDTDRDAAALADRARLLKDEVDTALAAVTNRSLSALTVISTLLLPPTFVVGAFGMNVEGLPFAHDPAGFWWVLGLCLALVGAGYAVLRRFRILP